MSWIRFNIILVFLFSSFQVIYAQEFLIASGQVTDVRTGSPLPFASVALVNSTLGTVTNEEGQFQLKISPKQRNDSLLIGYLGYQTIKTAIAGILETGASIGLEPKPLQLSEVEIVGLTPQEVIRRAVAHIPVNYGSDSMILTVYIRVQKIANSRLAEYAEAVVENLKDGYYLYPGNKKDEKFRHSNLPDLLKGRVVSDTNLVNAMGDSGKDATCLSCNFREDLVEFYPNTILDEKEFKKYNFTLVEKVVPGEGKQYQIFFDQKSNLHELGWKGHITIESSGYAILAVSMKPSPEAYEYYEKTKYNTVFFINGTPGWIKEMPMGETSVTYTRRGDRWALSTIHNDYWMIFRNPANGRSFQSRYKNDVVVTDVSRDPQKIRAFRGNKLLGVGKRWDQITGKADPDFWAGYNYLPIEEKLRQELSTINH